MSSPDPLSHTDDVSTQMSRMYGATNDIISLTKDLIRIGTDLNALNGEYQEVKAKIRMQKEIINSCKVAIRAEGSHL